MHKVIQSRLPKRASAKEIIGPSGDAGQRMEAAGGGERERVGEGEREAKRQGVDPTLACMCR